MSRDGMNVRLSRSLYKEYWRRKKAEARAYRLPDPGTVPAEAASTRRRLAGAILVAVALAALALLMAR